MCLLSPCGAQQCACADLRSALAPGDSAAAPFVLLLCARQPLVLSPAHEKTTFLHGEGAKALLIHAAAPCGVKHLVQGNQ